MEETADLRVLGADPLFPRIPTSLELASRGRASRSDVRFSSG
ncbi:hypothetical protein [Nocardioides ganghwensis]|nr:hypothetical protein [Nocardioides ganghwensis]